MNARFEIFCGSCTDRLTWEQGDIGAESRVDPAGHVAERGWRYNDFYGGNPHWKCGPCYDRYVSTTYRLRCG